MNDTKSLDKFTAAYIQCALWSSTEYRFGPCPVCGQMKVLSHYPEPEFTQEAMCSADGCGVSEIANPEPMDNNYSAQDLAPETFARMVADCREFQLKCTYELVRAEYGNLDHSDLEMAGHDFWLTRNGHGAGFWDGDLEESLGEALTKAAKEFGEFNLYVGDDGKLYGSNNPGR